MNSSIIFETPLPEPDPPRSAMRAAYLADEGECVKLLLSEAALDPAAAERVQREAHRLVSAVRENREAQGGLDAFLHQYDLSSQEGVVLMCIAEALLRIPDAGTADRLIRDKLPKGEWEAHLGQSGSMLVNASTWGLLLTGEVMEFGSSRGADPAALLKRLVARVGEAVVRPALKAAMGILADQFVMGRSIEEAIVRSGKHNAYRYSFDMLGEAALTAEDAERYHAAYEHAIKAVSKAAGGDDVFAAPGISVKLSALHPRYEFAQRSRVLSELKDRLLALALQAKHAGIALTLDAEESERLEPILDLFDTVYRDASLAGWEGFGLAVQAYQKRAIHVIAWLAELAREKRRRIPLRLVKGAYWDTEIKRAQAQGLAGYPVFTRKPHTDVSYLACVRRILAAQDAFYPQFATHNAHTIAYVLEAAGKQSRFEFQRLHGMGEPLYTEITEKGGPSTALRHGSGERSGQTIPCRVYAPVGSHEDLLPYLVRRLLENGANTSFVNRIAHAAIPIQKVIADPVAAVRASQAAPHPRIPLPKRLYGEERENSSGFSLSDPAALSELVPAMQEALKREWIAAPLIGSAALNGEAKPVTDPSNRRRIVGHLTLANEAQLSKTLALAHRAAPEWDARAADERAEILERAGNLFEAHRAELMALCVREGGKTIADSLSEVREAVDYCRYYAQLARRDFGSAKGLPGPTGERNELSLHGRGVFACISPWNFPLAIFCGQVAAALAAGNAVIAKPATQTTLVAMLTVRLLHKAGVPAEVLHFVPGPGSSIGMKLITDSRVSGIAFTGSSETARAMNQALSNRPAPIIPFIAETGGQNAMIVDRSALPEQVVSDVLQSAFNSAGQRCSALRVLFLQEDIADRVIRMLRGAMMELRVGDPALLATDVGPVIDENAKAALEAHSRRMAAEGKMIYQVPLPQGTEHGSFFAPRAFEIPRLSLLEREVFGPVLHVIRWQADHLDNVIEAINATGYGLTLGIHSRIEETVRRIRAKARVGNTYVNRNMIGAVVGVQPFGGEGLSGTGPKAGGPHYLHRFAVERTFTENTAAAGGNASLMAMGED